MRVMVDILFLEGNTEIFNTLGATVVPTINDEVESKEV